MILVLVAAASAVVRTGLAALLRAPPDFEVVGEADPASDLAAAIAERRPDVVVAELPHLSSLMVVLSPEGTQRSTGWPAFVVLTGDGSPVSVIEVQAGLRALLPLSASPDEIRAAVRAAAVGMFLVPAETAESLLSGIQTPLAAAGAERALPAAFSLSRREIEVLSLMAAGLGNKTIASRLGISAHTVKFHVGSILNKFNAASRTEAVALGFARGVIML